MTILTVSICGGRVFLIVDRQISRRSLQGTEVLAKDATKLLAVFCGNALFAVAYTGVAVAESKWMDETIASCLAFKKVEPAMAQPGSRFLSRPVHEMLQNLAFNLPIRLRSNPFVATQGLKLAVAGWHLRPRFQPFVCELAWNATAGEVGGSMSITKHKVAKHFRQFQNGLWLNTWGDTGERYEQRMHDLGKVERFTHDDVERFIVEAIVARSKETKTVGDQCLAVQLDPTDPDGHVQFTYYPGDSADDPHSLLSGWLLTPTMISSPTREATRGGSYSACNRYITGGFSDQNARLAVRTRLPIESMSHGGPLIISYAVEPRSEPSQT